MRRAAVSVPSKIIQGAERESQAEYLRFFEIALGSLRELHCQFDLAKCLGILIEMTFLAMNQSELSEKA
jgi:four helix bundle protein